MTHPFDKHYFHGGAKVGGYAGEGYRDFPVHWNTYAEIMKRKPESVLELGCGRGYVLKRLADFGAIPVMGLEISEHCRLTRAISPLVTHDVTQAPWPVAPKQFDLCVSVAFLEHVPEEGLPAVFAEMERTCKRGLHGIDIHDDDGFDKTHHTIRSLDWWRERLPPGHEAVDKEELEPPGPIVVPDGIGDSVKLNLGSFTHMFHGWRNIDQLDLAAWAAPRGYSFMRLNLLDGLPYDDARVDLVFMSHVLEHFNYYDGQRVLREIRRVLHPGGIVRIAVPDIRELAERYVRGDLSDFEQICGSEIGDDPVGQPARMFFELAAGGDHRAFYDQPTLIKALHAAGFRQVAPLEFRESLSPTMRRETIDLYPEMSLFVEAVA